MRAFEPFVPAVAAMHAAADEPPANVDEIVVTGERAGPGSLRAQGRSMRLKLCV